MTKINPLIIWEKWIDPLGGDEENYFIPEYGFKMMDMVVDLNHAERPNIISINDGEDFEAWLAEKEAVVVC